jgi:hypothetical protein
VITDSKSSHKVVKLTDITGSPDSLAVEADADVVLYKYVESQTDIIADMRNFLISTSYQVSRVNF